MTKISSVYQNVSVQSETECLNMQDKTGVWLKVGCELQTKSKLKGNKRQTLPAEIQSILFKWRNQVLWSKSQLLLGNTSDFSSAKENY